jgi:hypothetical protein
LITVVVRELYEWKMLVTSRCSLAGLLEEMLFVELAKVVHNWLWRSGRIGNMPQVGLGCFGKLAAERAKDRMGNIASNEGPIAWCG